MTAPTSYVPVDGGPWRLAMGLRPLDPARWLEVDNRRDEQLAEKARLLDEAHESVFAALPGSHAAGADLLDAVIDHLARHHPGTASQVVDVAGMHPVDAAARLVQEDLCVLERRHGEWVLTAASVCFPSRWSLAAKVGRNLSGIHGPVPGYETALAGPTGRFFDRLSTERPVWRLNWTLLDKPDLYQPGVYRPEGTARRRRGAPVDPGRDVWFRVERQTLRRLTDRPAITFTIRTYVTALADLLVAHPEAARALRATLPTVPPDTLAYKGWESLVPPLLAWLDARL